MFKMAAISDVKCCDHVPATRSRYISCQYDIPPHLERNAL